MSLTADDGTPAGGERPARPERASVLQDRRRPAGENAEQNAGQSLAATARRTLRRLARLDDGQMMRAFFYGLLATALVFVLIDWRTISTQAALVPSTNPATDPASPASDPVLPPALTTGEPEDAPGEVKTDPDVLRQAIRFELQPGGVLLAKGAIDPGAAARFATEIEARGEYVKVVSLDSPGGSVGDALAMSKLIRERQLNTLVDKGALCASSCPIVLSGGVERTAAEGAVVGVHQVFNGSREKLSPEMAMSEAQRTTATVTRHLDAMGIKPGLWQRAMETAPDRLAYLSVKEMRDFALTTGAEAAAAAP